MRCASKIEIGDITPAEAANQMRLTLAASEACLPSLLDRGFPPADPTTGNYALYAITVLRQARFRRLRLFPFSRNRSKRIHKKLVKRFGGEFRKQPCIWRVGDRIVAHPSYRAEIERATRGTILERRI